MRNGLKYNIRNQFMIIVDDRTLARLLRRLALNGININGFQEYKTPNNQNIFRFVVGKTAGENNSELLIVRDILQNLQVHWQEKQVIQILEISSGAPGQLGIIYGALWCKVKIEAIYFGEDTKLFLDVSANQNALYILSAPELKLCK
ncbi:hypothetical protein SAMN04488137_3353 [Fictibacillus solisalsi]|uniref:ACT domain-containing protein n=1 Tax=Fictibacillus solisalsi TaxID=459525 RepID=A0A1G9YDA9_9BACL|nr:hypothetical protein [Fictibacillus solisalsi]SDN06967.1 hypothetical protein SAMN04488137_3353 [Fictibacillus solisalsi]